MSSMSLDQIQEVLERVTKIADDLEKVRQDLGLDVNAGEDHGEAGVESGVSSHFQSDVASIAQPHSLAAPREKTISTMIHGPYRNQKLPAPIFNEMYYQQNLRLELAKRHNLDPRTVSVSVLTCLIMFEGMAEDANGNVYLVPKA